MKNLKVFAFSLLLISLKTYCFTPNLGELLQESAGVNWNKSVSQSVVIKAPLEKVWAYASNSNKANEWSVFFDHISPLPGIDDGLVGSKRRCFRNADEVNSGSWDEITISLTPKSFRQIVTYGFNNINIFEGFMYDDFMFVRQEYKAIDDQTTKLIFSTQISRQRSSYSQLIFWLSRGEVQRIFKLNLENIKARIEGQPRLHPWEK